MYVINSVYKHLKSFKCEKKLLFLKEIEYYCEIFSCVLELFDNLISTSQKF